MSPFNKNLHELVEKAKVKCGLDSVPGLFEFTYTAAGQLLIGQLDVKPWDERPEVVYKIVQPKHLLGGGLYDYQGNWDEIETDYIV